MRGYAHDSDELHYEDEFTSDAWSDDSLFRDFRDASLAPRTPPDLRKRGDTIAHYRIDSVLGRGGMGVVYAAEDTRHQRDVALKVLPAWAMGDRDRRRRFLREARTAARVQSPGIAAVLDVGEADGAVYLAMERVEGRSLRAVIQAAGGPLPPEQAARLALAVARGVAAAHAARIVHRDLKPDNVMVQSDGAVKLLDFGLAKDQSRDRAGDDAEADVLTREGHVLGTPAYMSPEQARGRPVDVRSDVFSLGVVLYEMTAGRRPFRGGTTMETLISIDRDPHLPIRAQNPRVPPALARIVDRCLAKSPDARYTDAAALAADLECFLMRPARVRRRPRARAAVTKPAAPTSAG
jgi:serine/threonine-protein kinase